MSKESDFINEVGTALVRLTHVFENHNITPTAIDLGSWEDGQSLLHLLDAEHRSYVELGMNPTTGEAVNQCMIAGYIVRWPVQRQAVRSQDGKLSWKYI